MNRFALAAAATLSLAAFHAAASADIIRHFNPPGTAPGQFPLVSTLLDSVGIGANNAASESVLETFFTPANTTTLPFSYIFDNGSYNFSFGVFPLSVPTADPITQKRDWAVQGLSAATEIFDDTIDNPDPSVTRNVAVPANTQLVFYLIPDNTLANFLSDPDLFYSGSGADSLSSPLFSYADANPGEFDQFLSFFANDKTLFTFEDITRTGNSDLSFGDIAFRIDNAILVPEPTAIFPLLATTALLLRRRSRTRA